MEVSQDKPKSYFHEAVTTAIRRLGLSVSSWTEFYLVEFLFKSVSKPPPDDPLVFQMRKAQEGESPLERFSLYRRAGDSALFLMGFFSEFMQKRGINRSYVAAMGGAAYSSAADLSPKGFDTVYCDLAEGFEEFALVLEEVREPDTLAAPQDIVRLYDKWKRTKSKATEDRLREEGVLIFPGRGGRKE